MKAAAPKPPPFHENLATTLTRTKFAEEGTVPPPCLDPHLALATCRWLLWGLNSMYMRVPGVHYTASRWSLKDRKEKPSTPNSQSRCSGGTGHTEAGHYDPTETVTKPVGYLLGRDNPTTNNGQQRPSIYRTGVYTHSPSKRRLTLASGRSFVIR
jgi:peptide methionine sulfoxide reductase MsrA